MTRPEIIQKVADYLETQEDIIKLGNSSINAYVIAKEIVQIIEDEK